MTPTNKYVQDKWIFTLKISINDWLLMKFLDIFWNGIDNLNFYMILSFGWVFLLIIDDI